MTGIGRISLVASLGLIACGGSGAESGALPRPSTAGAGSATAGSTATPTAGAAGTGPSTGGLSSGGNAQAGSAAGGNAGAPGGGSAGGSAGTAGAAGVGGGDPLDTPPTHTLNVQAAPGEHLHTVTGIPGMPNGMPAGVDNRLPKMMGKLIIDVEVDGGGTYNHGLKHGFHVLGPAMFHCNIAQAQNTYASEGKDFNGNCRLEVFDGIDHDTSSATGHAMVDKANSVSGRVKLALMTLQAKFPEEDWGYYLDAAGEVRWSDVGLTGYSHGASSSVRWAMAVRVWRAVARSGPRDNLCGSLYQGQTCKEDVISSWLDEQSKTPLDHIYGLTGTKDSEYGDIVFAMDRLKLPGTPVDITTAAPPYESSHRFIAQNVDHVDFNDKVYWPVMDLIWAVPPENVSYASSH